MSSFLFGEDNTLLFSLINEYAIKQGFKLKCSY